MEKFTKTILSNLKIVKLNEAQQLPDGISEEDFSKAIDEVISELKTQPLYKNGYEIYTDYHDIDNLEEYNLDKLAELLNSAEPDLVWDEFVWQLYSEAENEANWEIAQDVVFPEVCKKLGVELTWGNVPDELQDEIIDSVSDKIGAYVDSKKLLNKAESNLVLKSKYAYEIEDLVEYDEAGNITMVKGAVKWLLNLLGISIDEFVKGNDGVIKDIKEELENIGPNDFVNLVFCIKSSWDNAIELAKAHDIVISKGTNCGFVDFGEGSGSTVEIKLPKDITIRRKELDIEVDKEMRYGVDRIYGMTDKFWRDGEAIGK